MAGSVHKRHSRPRVDFKSRLTAASSSAGVALADTKRAAAGSIFFAPLRIACRILRAT